VRLLFPPGHPPPAELIDAAREHREALRMLLAGERGAAVLRQPYNRMLAALQSVCPVLVETGRWRQAIKDADCFLTTWGTRAHELGGTRRELVGLHPVPAHLGPTYRRLSRYDATGLIWLLRDRLVLALTETEAAIQGQSTVTVYHKDR